MNQKKKIVIDANYVSFFVVDHLPEGPITSIEIDPPKERKKEESEKEYVVHVTTKAKDFLLNVFLQGMRAQRKFDERVRKAMAKTMKTLPKRPK